MAVSMVFCMIPPQKTVTKNRAKPWTELRRFRPLLVGTVPVNHLLAGPVALQRPVGIRIRVIGLVAGLARAIHPCVAGGARHLADLPGCRVAPRLPAEAM